MYYSGIQGRSIVASSSVSSHAILSEAKNLAEDRETLRPAHGESQMPLGRIALTV